MTNPLVDDKKKKNEDGGGIVQLAEHWTEKLDVILMQV